MTLIGRVNASWDGVTVKVAASKERVYKSIFILSVTAYLKHMKCAQQKSPKNPY